MYVNTWISQEVRHNGYSSKWVSYNLLVHWVFLVVISPTDPTSPLIPALLTSGRDILGAGAPDPFCARVLKVPNFNYATKRLGTQIEPRSKNSALLNTFYYIRDHKKTL